MSELNLQLEKPDYICVDQVANEVKKKRRSKNIEDGRNFTCKCKKSYLSYPALYTHIKNKHPEKYYQECIIQIIPLENQVQVIKEKVKPVVEDKIDQNDNLQFLKQYLVQFFPFTHKEQETDRRITEISAEERIYLNTIKAYWAKHKKEEEIHENQIFITPIDYIFGKFLNDLEKEVSKLSYKYLQNFIINLRNGLNGLNKDDRFCNEKNGGNLPYQMNDLFIQKFQALKQDHLYMRHPTIICKTLFHFNRWLFEQHFTNYSLYYNAQ